MDKLNLESALEAVLFLNGEPLEIKRAAELLAVSEEEIALAAANLQQNLTTANRGLILIKNADSLQLTTKPQCSEITQKLAESEFKEELTPAAIEVMAILAYSGPLNRAEIDYVRGVNSSAILRNLSLRGLVEKKDKKHCVSFGFLRQLGLTSAEELPDYQHYQELIKKFRDNAI